MNVWEVDFIIFGARRCSTCGDYLPACTSYFTKDNRSASGMTSNCRDCRQNEDAMAKDRERKKRYREAARA